MGCFQNRPRCDVPRLSEVPTSSAVSQMNTWRKQLTSRVSVPAHSGREVARNTDTPKTSVLRILHGVLELCSYKLQSLQQLLPDDTAKRMAFVHWALSEFKENPQWLLSILWSDKTHFSLHGTINTHNWNRSLGKGKPTCIHRETPTRATCYCLMWFYLGNDSIIANMCCL